uniref:Competence protein A n=1 Tax=mine drainage metagenome TaxID=410659 RepID=E6QI36_9ZZZZ
MTGVRPPVAVAVSSQGIVAGATVPDATFPRLAHSSLPADAIHAGILEANLIRPGEISAAMRATLARVEPRGRSVTLVVPDAAVRIFVLDFDSLPTRRDEVTPVLRFRLRKSVPFDIEQAGLSYQVLSEGSARLETPWKVLVIVMPGAILTEYESALRGAGYEPGVVLPACLAALCSFESQQSELIAYLGTHSLTTAIVSGSDFLLYRTIDLPPEPTAQRAELHRSVDVACAFYEDTLQAPPHRLLYAGLLPGEEFAAIIAETGLAVEPFLRLTSDTSQLPEETNGAVAAVVGALAGTR